LPPPDLYTLSLHDALPISLQTTKDDAGALQAAQDAARRFPDQAQTHFFLAQQLLRVGRYQDAAPSFERTAQLDQGNVEARLGLRSEEHTSELQSRSDLVCR